MTNPEPEEAIEITQSFRVGLGTEVGDAQFSIDTEYLNLTIKANGKADLYFHAYVWTQYLNSLTKSGISFDNADYRPRLDGLAKTLGKVIQNVKKFPFTQESYDKYI